MTLRAEDYQQLVQRAMEFMRGRQGTPTTAADIAAHVSCSQSHLRRIFRAVTGKGVFPAWRQVCIERARQLLTQTGMAIGEIALASGFESHSSFNPVFRQYTGTTPGQFRKSMQEANPAGLMSQPKGRGGGHSLTENGNLTADRLSAALMPEQGSFKATGGWLEATCPDWLIIGLRQKLPENFRFEFELQVPETNSQELTEVELALHAGRRHSDYMRITLPVSSTTPGALNIRGRNMLVNPEASVTLGQWHRVRVELMDNRVAVHLNLKRIFLFRDLFPAIYSARNHLGLRIHQCRLLLRGFRLLDLGYPPVVPEIRQGDTLFNSGLFSQALDFYQRRLIAGISNEDEMELRFKTGMCMYRQGRSAQCRDWFHSILPMALTPYWRRECSLILLQLDAEADSFSNFERHVRMLIRDPALLDGIRSIISDRFFRLRNAGFLESAVETGQLWMNLEKSHPVMPRHVRGLLAAILKKLKQYEAATRLLRPLDRPSTPPATRTAALFSLCDIGLSRRQFKSARTFIRKIQNVFSATAGTAWDIPMTAYCLQAERRFEEEEKLLRTVCSSPDNSAGFQTTIEILLAELLYCRDSTAEADTLYRRASATILQPRADPELLHRLACLAQLKGLDRGNPIELLREESFRESNTPFARGQCAVSAGILLELDDNRAKAIDLWKDASRRFPPEHCYFMGSLAKALSSDKPDALETFHYYFTVQSHMLHLGGLLLEHRGNSERARQLFSLAVKTDPTIRWPRLLSERKLEHYRLRSTTRRSSVRGAVRGLAPCL